MAGLVFKNLCKQYEGGETPAVSDLSLEIDDKEFVVLVGPSAVENQPHCGWWQGWRRSRRENCSSMGSG